MLALLKSFPALASMVKRPPLIYGRARKMIRYLQEMDATQRDAFQSQRITAMLTLANTLPGYQGNQRGRSLSNWPILEKTGIAGREEQFLPRHLVSASAATGGTTGKPLSLRRSLAGIAFEQAHIDLLCERAGIDPRTAKTAILRGDSIIDPVRTKPPFWLDQGKHKRIFSAHHLNHDTLDLYTGALDEFKPSILFCYPSSLQHLVTLTEEAGQSGLVQIPLIFSSSEMLDPQLAVRARQLFRSTVIDYYGHAERVVSAYSLESDEFWFDPAYGHVELVPCGTGLADIIATSLWPNGQVFIRYKTGDVAKIDRDCPDYLRKVALGLLPFAGIEGRSNEFIELPDGRRIIGLNHIPRGVPAIQSVQLYRSQSSVHIYITPASGFGAKSFERLAQNLHTKFPQDTRFEWFLTEAPLREPNGKAPLLLRNPVRSRITPVEFKNENRLEPA